MKIYLFVPSSIELEGTGVEELNHIKASKMNNDSYGHLLWLKTHKFLDIYNRSRVITKQTCLLWFQAYKMSADPRGHVLIINIRKFTDPDLSERGGENCLPWCLYEMTREEVISLENCWLLGIARHLLDHIIKHSFGLLFRIRYRLFNLKFVT